MAGSYSIVQADLKFTNLRLKQLTSEDGASIDTSKIDAAIVDAEEEFHLYAGVYYETPVRTSDGAVPEGLKQKLVASARWFLMQNRSEALTDEVEGKLWEKRRAETLAWLASISDSDSKDRLPIAGAIARVTADAPRGGRARLSADVGVFTPARMKGFR